MTIINDIKVKSEQFEKPLFTEMRTMVYSTNESIKITNELLQKAVTANENLGSFGFILSTEDIIKLATSNELDIFCDKIKLFMPDIKAKPMYPNFPTQVLDMDEAMLRFHQSVHYFSTYGIEYLLDCTVEKGWLPNVEDTDKIKKDKKLLSRKVIKLVTIKEIENIITNLLSKKEKFTLPEIQLVKSVFLETNLINKEEKMIVAFKDNIKHLIVDDFKNEDNEVMRKTTLMLLNICQHTGDVLDFIWNMINIFNFKQMRTSQKRVLVQVLCSFECTDFAENLALKRERNLTILRYLSFNKMSKSERHKEVVDKLRKNEIKTWSSQVEHLLSNAKTEEEKEEALYFISKRNGVLLRMAVRLLRLGYKKEDIEDCLLFNSASLKTQTLISTINSFKRTLASLDSPHSLIKDENKEEKRKEATEFISILSNVINVNILCKETPILNKKVYVDSTIFNLDKSYIQTNDKQEEGGYLRSGLSIAIPEEINRLRFFVYWNNKKQRIDIDLHSTLTGRDGDSNELRIGWDSHLKKSGVVLSGDLTVNDSAEYIDIDIEEAIKNEFKEINCHIVSYTDVPFCDIDTLFTGMLAVDSIDTNVDLYNSSNLFFRHDLQSNKIQMNYCTIDIEDRTLTLSGEEGTIKAGITVAEYIDSLIEYQLAVKVDTPEEADVILSLDKTTNEKNISLIDYNYFMDY